MIDLSLDRHDFATCVEGFAHGSHLRQHVWREIVFRNIPQMTEDEMDFFWYIFRRNLWDCYFRERNGFMIKDCGHDNYLHALAALHRGNRYKVSFLPDNLKRVITVECYRFAGHYRPLRVPGQKSRMAPFEAFIPDERIKEVIKLDMPGNPMVQQGREVWWTDLSVYDNPKYVNSQKAAMSVTPEIENFTQQFKDCCNKLAELINLRLFDGDRRWYWIGDDVGGTCDFEEADAINAEDMVRILENGMDYDEYSEWRDANLDNNRYINLKSWLMGARHDMFKDKETE